MATVYYPQFEVCRIAADGSRVALPALTVDVYNVTAASSLGTLVTDANSIIVEGSFTADIFDVIEISHATYPLTCRFTLTETQDEAYTLAENHIAIYIAENLYTDTTESQTARLYLIDLDNPDAAPQYLADLKPGVTTDIPYQTSVSKNVRLAMLSQDIEGQFKTNDVETATETFDITIPAVTGTYQPLDATLTALAGANWAANSLAVGSGSDTVAQVTFAANTFPARASTGNLVAKTITDFGLSLIDDADASAARTTLGLVIGTNVQAYDADLTTWAGLTPSANAQSLVTAADYSAMRTLLSLVPGTNVQAYDADLATIAGLTATTDNFIVSVASAWASRTPAQVRTTLGLVIGTNVQAWDTELDSLAGLGVAQGDLIYGSAATTYSKLAKDTNATRYLSNQGTSNNPSWNQINLANGVTGDLPFANLTQGAALTVLANATNGTADFAALAAGSDHQVLRRSGTALAFGAVNLASSAAVTGTLPVANGGTGVTSSTGSVAVVLSTSPTIASPTLSGTTTISNANGAGYESTISGSVSSPYDILTILSKGGGGGWGGQINFDVSYNGGAAGTVFQIKGTGTTGKANSSFGGSADRSTTNGESVVNIFNGTAPSGTLTNGASFYAASGEMRVMDSAGNSTLLSPHDADTNEHIYFSKNTETGKVLVVETERMWRALDAMLGGGYIHEFNEEPGTPHLPRKDYDKNWKKKIKGKI